MKKGNVLIFKVFDLAYGGKGVAKVTETEEASDKVVFIENALPGQVVKARVIKNKASYAEAKLLEVLQSAPEEIEVDYQQPPGAPWLKLPIETQQKYKKQQVAKLFKDFAGIDLDVHWDEYVESPVLYGYRNKMEYSFGPSRDPFPIELETSPEENKAAKKTEIIELDNFALGSKQRGQFYLVESLEKPSGLFDPVFESLLPQIRQLAQSFELPVFSSRSSFGFWRQLLVRKSFYTDSFVVTLVVSDLSDPEKTQQIQTAFRDFFRSKLEDKLGGLIWQTTDIASDDPKRYVDRTLLHGSDTLIEKLAVGDLSPLDFEISLDSFFQTNPKSAEKLYTKVMEYVREALSENLSKSPVNKGDLTEEVLMDLFCGTGTITQLLKAQFPTQKVVGVELVAAAIKDAQKNMARNGLTEIDFYADDVGKYLSAHPEHIGQIKLAVMDPPRAGIAPKTLKKVIQLGAEHLVYVSCNPATQARDLKTLQEFGYQVQKLSLVDQFPHTSHVESVAWLKK